jgi:hypothetical protein
MDRFSAASEQPLVMIGEQGASEAWEAGRMVSRRRGLARSRGTSIRRGLGLLGAGPHPRRGYASGLPPLPRGGLGRGLPSGCAV